MEDMKQQLDVTTKKARFWELDFLRGLCVLLMVFDHVMYTIGFVMPMVDASLGKTVWDAASMWASDVYWVSSLRTVTRTIVLALFFGICGISCTFSRSNFKRGSFCFLIACGVSCITVLIDIIFDMGISIYFGVLHMLGVSMLLFAIFDFFGNLIAKIGKEDKVKRVTRIIGDYLAPTVGLVLIIVFFACFFDNFDGIEFVTKVSIEDESISKLVSLLIPVQSSIVGGSDFWSLLPWAAFVLAGGFVGRGLYRSKAQNFLSVLDGKWNKPVCFVGKHALFVYVAHQVAAVAVLYLITLIA